MKSMFLQSSGKQCILGKHNIYEWSEAQLDAILECSHRVLLRFLSTLKDVPRTFASCIKRTYSDFLEIDGKVRTSSSH